MPFRIGGDEFVVFAGFYFFQRAAVVAIGKVDYFRRIVPDDCDKPQLFPVLKRADYVAGRNAQFAGKGIYGVVASAALRQSKSQKVNRASHVGCVGQVIDDKSVVDAGYAAVDQLFFFVTKRHKLPLLSLNRPIIYNKTP